VVVNPGDWKLEQLIQPEYGATFTSDNPPRLLWAPVPGAAKYQVGFSTQPYLGTIHEWFDVVDNRWEVPDNIWRNLPNGQLYWTVRAVETSGTPRKPLPMRGVYRVAEGGLTSTRPKPARTTAGHTLLEWKPAQTTGYYFVTISSDAEATQIIRQYLTGSPQLDLRVADRKLTPGTTYYWQVDAIAPNGALIMSGPVQSFFAEFVPQASLNADSRLVQLASLGIPEALPSPPDLAAQISGQTPAPNSSTNQLQPTISVGFQSPVNPADVSLMIDDVDITTLAQVSDVKVSFTPPLALSGGDHNINLTVGSEAATWKFTVLAPTAPAPATAPSVPAAGTLQAGTDAEVPPPGQQAALPTPGSVAAVHRGEKARTLELRKGQGPSEEGQISSTTQWASGSNPPDSNVLSTTERMTYQHGKWNVEEALPPGTSQYEDATVRGGTTYYYRVRSVNSRGDLGSPSSAAAAQSQNSGTLPKVEGLTVDAGQTRVRLTWKPVDLPVAGYFVERRALTGAAGAENWVRLNPHVTPEPLYDDYLGLSSDMKLEYRVLAVGFDNAEGPPSAAVQVVLADRSLPDAPSITGSSGANGKTVLDFAPADQKAAQFLVLRSGRADDLGVVIGDPLPGSARQFTDLYVSAGQNYWYRLVTVDKNGNRSDPTPPVAVRVGSPQLAAPPAPTAQFAGTPYPHVVLQFQAPPDGLTLIVERQIQTGTAPSGWIRIAGPMSSPTATDNAVPLGSVGYRISYVASDGKVGPASTVVTVTNPGK
jgi:hypothetical protein